MNINVNGLFAVTQAIGMEMIKRKQTGSIINIASMSSHVVNTPQDQCCYNASKAAVRHLSASLATEWAKYNIRVNSISPGYMDTKLNQRPQLEPLKTEWKKRTPMARLGKEDELNGLAVFLASDASSFMTATDVIIDVS